MADENKINDILNETAEYMADPVDIETPAESTAVPEAEVTKAEAPKVETAETEAHKTEPVSVKADKEPEIRDRKAERAEAKEQRKREKRDQKRAKIQAAIDQCPKEYKPLGTSTYFWLSVLYSIPLLGFIFVLILSAVPRNRNLKNFTRAILVFYLIAIIIALITGIVIMFLMPDPVRGDFLGGVTKIAQSFGM